jgi:hypothetical protein
MLIAYLSGGDELKRSESGLQVSGVGLEVIESSSNAGLELRWLRTGRAVRRDLVEGTHVCWLSLRSRIELFAKRGYDLCDELSLFRPRYQETPS